MTVDSGKQARGKRIRYAHNFLNILLFLSLLLVVYSTTHKIECPGKVRAKGTVGKRAEPRESGSSAPSEHCGSCWDKRNRRAWLQHGCCAPIDCRSPILGGRTQE